MTVSVIIVVVAAAVVAVVVNDADEPVDDDWLAFAVAA